MKLPRGATSFSPPPGPLNCGRFEGARMRHTVRADGGKDWLLIYTLHGSGEYRHAGGVFRSKPHDITLYRRGTPQDYRLTSERRWDLLYAHFLPPSGWLPWLHWPELSAGFMRIEVAPASLRKHLPHRLVEMIRLRGGSEPRREALALNALEEVLLWCDSINPARAEPQIDPRVRLAMDYLSVHCHEPYGEATLGREAGLSGSRLRHLFRAQTGLSPRAFQEEKRMDRARLLLAQSNQSIAEISWELGFENPFYFSLRFKKHSGQSPREFRHRVMGNQ